MGFGCSRGPLQVVNSGPVDLNAAVTQAKAQNKLVLLDFTGSDWCVPCMRLQKEIFSRPEFQTFAASNLVFVVVDFPSKFRFPAETTATNEFLRGKFSVDGFPTLVALNGDGKEIWRRLGPLPGGLKSLDAELASAKSQAK